MLKVLRLESNPSRFFIHEPLMREIYDKVRRGDKKRSKVAIVAVARQLLVRCWAILRDESCWDADHAKRLANS